MSAKCSSSLTRNNLQGRLACHANRSVLEGKEGRVWCLEGSSTLCDRRSLEAWTLYCRRGTSTLDHTGPLGFQNRRCRTYLRGIECMPRCSWCCVWGCTFLQGMSEGPQHLAGSSTQRGIQSAPVEEWIALVSNTIQHRIVKLELLYLCPSSRNQLDTGGSSPAKCLSFSR